MQIAHQLTMWRCLMQPIFMSNKGKQHDLQLFIQAYGKKLCSATVSHMGVSSTKLLAQQPYVDKIR